MKTGIRLPQVSGAWKNVAALVIVPIILGLKSAYDSGHLGNLQMAWAAIISAFFGGIVPQLVGWLAQESPVAPHVVDDQLVSKLSMPSGNRIHPDAITK